MERCRHCEKLLNKPKIRVGVKEGCCTSYFYYPDHSCKTDDGGMRMLINKLDELAQEGKDYELKVESFRDALLGDNE